MRHIVEGFREYLFKRVREREIEIDSTLTRASLFAKRQREGETERERDDDICEINDNVNQYTMIQDYKKINEEKLIRAFTRTLDTMIQIIRANHTTMSFISEAIQDDVQVHYQLIHYSPNKYLNNLVA